MDKTTGVVLFSILAISALASSASQPAPQIAYWKKLLPHASMPTAISDLISNDGGVHDSSINNAKSEHVSPDRFIVIGHMHHHPITININPFHYTYAITANAATNAATNTQIHEDPRVTLFFLQKKLVPDTKMNLNFTKVSPSPSTTFIPRKIANSIPFTSSKLPEILNYFSIPPNSIESELIKKTLEECELPAPKGERKHCATSLESMVDFSIESLGTNELKAVSTKAGKVQGEKEYVISGVEKMEEGKMVACHLQEYAYAVFYCHATNTSEAYMVKMKIGGSEEVEAVAVCHMDTKKWNPKHVAFRVLGVKPGCVPICHFLPQDHVVWVAEN